MLALTPETNSYSASVWIKKLHFKMHSDTSQHCTLSINKVTKNKDFKFYFLVNNKFLIQTGAFFPIG